MKLYLMRHADALPVGGTISRDADRMLSVHGEEAAALMGRALMRVDPNIDIIITSPLVRAVQTGEIVGREAGTPPVFHTTEHLAPGYRPKALVEELIALSGGGNIVAIGHQPDLGLFASYLIADSPDAAISFETGAIAAIKVNAALKPVRGNLRWLLTPGIVNSIMKVKGGGA